MKKIIAALIVGLLPLAGWASGGAGAHLEKAEIDLADQASLQRGARLFVNYCLSCHGAAYQRYNRMAADIGLSEDQVAENLMFATEKVGQTMTVATDPDDAATWFGTKIPDLSLVARSRGVDWLYTYLLSFYQDPSRPWGVNNLVFPDVGMPHVLWELQGIQAPVEREVEDEAGNKHTKVTGFELVREGSMTDAEYQGAMLDLVTFLAYVAEPAKLERQRVGLWVLIFLVIAFFVTYALKKEYWRDIH